MKKKKLKNTKKSSKPIKQKKITKPKKTVHYKRPRKTKVKIIHEEKLQTNILSDYIFNFELTRQYPTTRAYLLKKPLKKSFKDSFFELFGSR
ncbi:MAG: hypothetical protein ABH842_02915 [Candidatus Micrarchaeota archaeon]